MRKHHISLVIALSILLLYVPLALSNWQEYGTQNLLLVWGHSTRNAPDYSTSSLANSWAGATSMTDVGADTDFVEIFQKQGSSEKAVFYVDSVSDLHVEIWDGSSMSSYTELETDMSSPTTHPQFTAAYESASGDLLSIFIENNPLGDRQFVSYRIYNGTGWGAKQQYGTDFGSLIRGIVAKPNPKNDEILVLFSDGGNDLNALIWNGTAFTNEVVFTSDLETVTNTPGRAFDAAWLRDGSTAVVVYDVLGSSVDEDLWSVQWNGTAWLNNRSETDSSSIGSTGVDFIVLQSSQFENKIRGATYDEADDISIFELNSTLGVTNFTEVDSSVQLTEGLYSVDVAMPSAGRFLYVWDDTIDLFGLNDSYNTGDIVSLTSNNARGVRAYTDFNSGSVVIAYSDSGSDLGVLVWNSTSGTTTETLNIETSLEGVLSFDIAINQFTGIIQDDYGTNPSTPIIDAAVSLFSNSTSVEGSIDWVNFTLTNPSGTNVIDNVNGTLSGGYWNSSEFTLNALGTWTWEIRSHDTENFLSIRTGSFILADTTPPTVFFDEPSPANNSYIQNVTFAYSPRTDYSSNATDNFAFDDGGSGSLTFKFFNDSGTTHNFFFDFLSGTFNYSSMQGLSTELTEGRWQWYPEYTDASGNIGVPTTNRTLWVDYTAPVVTIVIPSDSAQSSDIGQDVNYTASDNLNLGSCWWTEDAGATNNSITCGINITSQTWSEGSNTVVVYANDSSGRESSDSVSFTIDSTNPSVSSLTETPSDPATYIFNAVYEFNATVTDSNLETILLEFDGTNYTATNVAGNVYNVSFTDLSAGSRNYRWYANDSFGNSNSSGSGSYTINKATLAFSTSVTSPVTYGTASDYSGSESNSGDTGCSYVLNREGTQIATGSSVSDTTTLGVGTHEYNYSSTGCTNYNVGSDVKTLTVNKAVPEGSLTSSSTFSIEAGTEVTIGLSESNSGDGDVTYVVFRDGVSKGTGETFTPDPGSYSYLLNTTGGANWTANASMDTETLTVTDSVSPVVSIVTPSAGVWYDFNTVNVNYTVVEAYSQACWWTEDAGATNNSITCGINITSQTWSEGSNTVVVYANDTSGNEGSDSIQFNVDTIFPSISMTFPSNISYTSDVTALNLTVSDVNLNTCWYSLDTGVTNTSITCGNNVTGLLADQGSNTWIVYANDSANNVNSSSITFTVDSQSPTIDYVAPTETDGTIINQDFIEINVTAVDVNLQNITIRLYNSTIDLINTTTSSTSPNYVNISGLSDGIYYFNATSTDSSNQQNNSATRNVTLDTTTPLISFQGDTPLSGSNQTHNSISLNVSVTETNEDTIIFLLHNSTGQVNSTSFTDSTRFINFTGLPDETYTFNVTINDTVTLSNTTASRTVIIDSTVPSLTLVSPAESESFSTNVSLSLNFSASDLGVGLDSCWFNLDGSSNTTIPNCVNTTFNTSGEGTFVMNLFANDTLGQESLDSNTFSVSLAAPSVNLDSPANATFLNFSTNIYLNYTATDSNLDTCITYHDFDGTFKANESNSGVTSGQQNFSLYTSVSDGTYLWNVFCNDTINNGNFALNNRTFTIDTIFPSISYGAGVENDENNFTRSNVFVNVSVTETNEDTIIFLLHNSTGQVNSTSFTDSTRFINFTGLPDETYTFNVTINDSAGNTNVTTIRTIRLDNTAPSISIAFPDGSDLINNDTIELNFSISDAVVGVDACWYRVSNATATVIDNTTLAGCSNTTFGVHGGDNNFQVDLFSNDTLGNEGSDSVAFGIRTIAPAVVLDNPTEDEYLNTLNNIRFNFTATDLDGISTCDLYGNWTGSFILNQTLTSVTSAQQTNFNLLNLTEGVFLYNVFCNDTLNNGNFASSNRTFTTDITFPLVNITAPANATSVSSTFTFNYSISDTNIDSCQYNMLNLSGSSFFTPNQSLTCGSTTQSVTVTAGDYDLQIWGSDLSGNENTSTIRLTVTADAGGGGGGGGGDGETVKVFVNKTFCGDLMCQAEGNDAGQLEDFFSCPLDCPGFNIDTAIFGCFSDDPELMCIWQQVRAQYIGLILSLGLGVLFLSTTKDRNTGKQIPLYKFVLRGRNRRRKIKTQGVRRV